MASNRWAITPTIVISTFLFIGYLFMLLSVILDQPISVHQIPPSSSLTASVDLELLKKQNENQLSKIISLEKEIDVLRHVPKQNAEFVSVSPIPKGIDTPAVIVANRPGVIILGMHRSGTSILGGLVNKMGLATGGPLIQAAEDNEKGFFERIDVVLQNDYLMQKQKCHYGWKTHLYDTQLGVKHVLTEEVKFNEGRRALEFLNSPTNYPWMLKDPRLCITLRTWLPLLNFIPVVLFTYRHPLDVALSLHKREYEQYTIPYALKLWYVYNKRAIQQSNDLCRVVTSHFKTIKLSNQELDYIHDELIKCGVPVPRALTSTDISDFIDIKLQHGKTTLKENPCTGDLAQLMPPRTWEGDHTSDQLAIYREAMRLYCAMEDKSAFSTKFKFNDDIKNI